MPEHRERVDKRTSAEINRRVMIPLLTDLGARYLLKPYLGAYRDEEKSPSSGASATTTRRATGARLNTRASTTVTAR